ncbi:ornithine cyclodeaminase [Microtetraspora fusca]|uniref:Ornithine cyclodeaminase n=1 Tax=Microtetraspora fusca TaxID=1997 RepID=A0ABW6V064_MICFU|nr:ornithine cyclodeaminase [Microtetraspora fusca]
MAAVPDDALLYLNGADVSALCARIPVTDVVRATFQESRRGNAGVSPEAALRWTTPDGYAARSLILPAWAGDDRGCKIINASMGNERNGLPRAHGLIVLNDPESAMPRCLMEGARISALRTAAVSVVALEAVRPLADVGHVAFLGCGRQAATHLELLRQHCPRLSRVTVFDADRGRAERFAADAGMRVQVVGTALAAVRDAEITVAVTTTTTPYVELDWLPPGGIFVNVSLDDATEDLLLGCDHLFVDDWALVAADSHRLLGRLYRAGKAAAPDAPGDARGRRVDAELPVLVSGGYHRPIAAHERVVINPFGMGMNDIALAAAVYERAVSEGVGRWLER